MRSVSAAYLITGLTMLALVVYFVSWVVYRPEILAPSDIPNVLLISIDTCRTDHLGCYGYKHPTTRNIDAIAADGILFENAISQYALTLPAHSAMPTDTTQPYHGVHSNLAYLSDTRNIMLAEILKNTGFTTSAMVGSVVLDLQFAVKHVFYNYHDCVNHPGSRIGEAGVLPRRPPMLKWSG